MSKEKQIEEMASILCKQYNNGKCNVYGKCEDNCSFREDYKRLYNAGYRKQSEGEWKQTIEPLGAHDVDCVECSVCGESWVLDEDFDYDVVKDFWNYCPICGAKMKGGE